MSEHVNLLWTGGWDSTFRMLHLLLEEEKSVQPYYLHINSRKSSQKEIETMAQIRNYLQNELPITRQLLSDTKFFKDNELIEDAGISKAYKELKSNNYLGDQFETLARFAKQYKITGLEFCLEKGNYAKTFIFPHMETVHYQGQSINRINIDSAPKQIMEILGSYRFPLVHLTRQEMVDIVKQKGWMHIMNMTWFCHHPILNRYPCGVCNPCMYVREDNMEWRIPFPQRIAGKLVKKVFNSSFILKLRNF